MPSSIWMLSAYLAWKREQVVAALASRGLEAPVEEVAAGAASQPAAGSVRSWPDG